MPGSLGGFQGICEGDLTTISGLPFKASAEASSPLHRKMNWIDTKIRLCLSQVGSCWRTRDRRKQRIVRAQTFMIGILRYLKIQAVTPRKSATRRQSFVKLRLAPSSVSTETACGFSHWLNSSGYKT